MLCQSRISELIFPYTFSVSIIDHSLRLFRSLMFAFYFFYIIVVAVHCDPLPLTSSSSASSMTSSTSSSSSMLFVSSLANFRCPEQFGYYADEYNCSKYFVCVFGEALHESCTGGLYFSSELSTCDWKRNVVCPAEGMFIALNKPILNSTGQY